MNGLEIHPHAHDCAGCKRCDPAAMTEAAARWGLPTRPGGERWRSMSLAHGVLFVPQATVAAAEGR